MPLTYYGESTVAYPSIFGGVATPATYYFGLQTTSIWAATTSVATGAFYIPTAFDTFTTPGTGTNRIFVATTTGTTASSEPTWSSVSAGGTVVDGTVTWQDVASTSSPFWLSTTPSFGEVSSNGYTRVAYANNTTNFPAPSGSSPTTGTNANIITFPTSTGSWGNIAAISIHSALTGGSVIAFAYLSRHLAVTSSGTTPSIPASTGLSLSLT